MTDRHGGHPRQPGGRTLFGAVGYRRQADRAGREGRENRASGHQRAAVRLRPSSRKAADVLPWAVDGTPGVSRAVDADAGCRRSAGGRRHPARGRDAPRRNQRLKSDSSRRVARTPDPLTGVQMGLHLLHRGRGRRAGRSATGDCPGVPGGCRRLDGLMRQLLDLSGVESGGGTRSARRFTRSVPRRSCARGRRFAPAAGRSEGASAWRWRRLPMSLPCSSIAISSNG